MKSEFTIKINSDGDMVAEFGNEQKICNNIVELGLFQLKCYKKNGIYQSLENINADIAAYETILRENRVAEYRSFKDKNGSYTARTILKMMNGN